MLESLSPVYILYHNNNNKDPSDFDPTILTEVVL